MELKRYQKKRNELGRVQLEVCDSDIFVAFWKDHNYVSAHDRDGVEWLLSADTTLRDIENADDQLVRIHHSRLIRRSCIESHRYVRPKGESNGYGVVRVGGHDYRSSRRYWTLLACKE